MVNIPQIIHKMADDAKSKFEKERNDVLKALPDELKNSFGTIGFTLGDVDDDDDDEANKAVPYMQPVLIVSPYDVPPKPVRDIYWMDAFAKAKRSKAKLKKLDYLVYVYGSDDPDDCYNFVKHEDFVTLQEGRDSGLDILPRAIADKPADTRTESEQKIARAFDELKVDIDKAPEDRKHGDPFLERHEKLLVSEAEKDKSKSQSKSQSPRPAKKQKT